MASKAAQNKQLFVPPLPKTPTIFHQWINEKLLLDSFPKDKKFCKVLSKNIVNLSGPFGEDCPDAKFSRGYGSSFSLYPMYQGNASREGDPICDSYRMQIHNNAVFFCLADGCNWGERPRQASNRAKDAFIGFLQQRIPELKTSKDIGPQLVNALAVAHLSIIYDKEDIFMAGTTTLLGGLALKLDGTNQYALMAIGVGDCKIYHYNAAEKKIYDVTSANRAEVEDAKDPGGRIGPYVKDGEPDLRNLEVLYTTCSPGDVMMVVSDGVHDNLDPITLGKAPKDLGLEGDSHADWKTVDKTKKNVAKEKFMTDLMNQLVAECPFPTPVLITKRVIRYVRQVTESSRVFMEQNPQAGMANLSYTEYPGKMDHTTCIAFKIGDWDPNVSEEGDGVQSLNPDILRV